MVGDRQLGRITRREGLDYHNSRMAGDEDEKKADEDKDLELDLMAEAELLRLTRQYRIMEGDKEAYSDEANKILRRQRKTLVDMERERKEVEERKAWVVTLPGSQKNKAGRHNV